jgi:hypothetical protein
MRLYQPQYRGVHFFVVTLHILKKIDATSDVSIYYSTILSNLYYKEQRQLKIFLTQIGPALPLTPDAPVICFWKWIGWKDYKVPKNRNLESVSAKS